jgi:DNA polymerase III delta subunit
MPTHVPSQPGSAPAGGAILAFVGGDDEWGIDRAADAIAERLTADSGEPPLHWRVNGADVDPGAIAERVATATLFGAGTLAMVVDPGALVRAAERRAATIALLGSVAPGNGLVFLAMREGRAGSTAGLDALRTAVADAGGEVVEVHAPRPDRFPEWLVARARERGMELPSDAAREMADRLGAAVREGDVDRSRLTRAAIGELEKLHLYAAGRRLTAEDVRALVPEAVPASIWGFLDAVAERHPGRIGAALDPMLEGTPEPVLVAALHRRLRDLVEVEDRLRAGETPGSLVRSMRIKEYPARKLAAQSARWTAAELDAALDGLGDYDALVKGETPASEAQRRLAFTMWIRDRVTVR